MADEIVGGLKGIQKELRAVQDQMAGLDAGSEQFGKLARKAGELRDKMKDVKEVVNSQAGPALENLGNSASRATGQLMSLDFEGFGESLKLVGGNIKNINFGVVKDGLSSIASGFGAIAKALFANPLFLIAGTIALIAMNMDKVYKMFPSFEKGLKGIGDEERAIAKAIELRAEASKKAYDQSSLEVNQMKLAGKTEREIVEYRMARLKTSIADAKVQLETSVNQAKMQIDTAKRNKEILDGILMFINVPMTIILDMIDRIGMVVGKDFGLNKKFVDLMSSYVVDPVQIEADLNKSIVAQQDALKQMESDYVGFQLNLKEIDKKASDTKKQNAKAEKEEIVKRDEEELKSIKSRDITRIESANKQIELKTAITNHVLSEEERQTIAERKAANERREIWAAAWYAKYELASATTNAMMSLNDALTESGVVSAEKGFKIGKALSMAQTTISTIQGVQNALSAVTTIPEPFGTALKIANAVAIGASGAANLAKIAKTEFKSPNSNVSPSTVTNSGGTAMGGSMGGQSPAALNLSALQGNTSVAPLQTYVVAGQVSSAQQAEFKIKNTASILGGG